MNARWGEASYSRAVAAELMLRQGLFGAKVERTNKAVNAKGGGVAYSTTAHTCVCVNGQLVVLEGVWEHEVAVAKIAEKWVHEAGLGALTIARGRLTVEVAGIQGAIMNKAGSWIGLIGEGGFWERTEVCSGMAGAEVSRRLKAEKSVCRDWSANVLTPSET